MQHDFLLLDRSGSMAGRWNEAISAINSYVHELAKNKTDTGVTLAVFDSGHDGKLDFQIIRERIIPSTWKDVTSTEVSPRNGTPLNDATAKILDLAEAGGYEKLALIIMTDGEENSSREFKDPATIKARLDKFRTKGYQVIYLGADFDNQTQATSYGAGYGQTISTSAANFTSTMRATAIKRGLYGSGIGSDMSYSALEKTRAASKTAVDVLDGDETGGITPTPKTDTTTPKVKNTTI